METAGAAGVFTSALAIPGQREHVRAARAFTNLVLGVHDRDDDVAALGRAARPGRGASTLR